MAETVSVTNLMSIQTRETLDADAYPALTNRVNTHKGEVSETLNGSSTPKATKSYNEKLTGTGGTVTIDLTDFPTFSDPGGVDGTGLKLQLMQIQSLDSDGVFVIDEGASNGYQINNGNPIQVDGSGSAQFSYQDKLDDVAVADATLDWTGTTDKEFLLTLILG